METTPATTTTLEGNWPHQVLPQLITCQNIQHIRKNCNPLKIQALPLSHHYKPLIISCLVLPPPHTQQNSTGPTDLPTTIDAAYITPLQMHNPAEMPFTSSFSSPASPATPMNAFSIHDSSTRISAIQTVQTYLTQQAQVIQSHMTSILPGLIQGEVRTQCTQLAQDIGAQISSIQEEVVKPSGNQDDPMLPSSEEGENKGGSRGHGKQSTRHRYNKRKERFRTENNNKAAETCRHHHHSQQSKNGDEADEEDEGSGNESDEEKISAGSQKYKKQIQVLRVSIYSCSL